MDIYGLNPKLRGEKPNIDWENSTDVERELYFQESQQFQSENPGVYFRANVWSWRPMAEVILICAEEYGTTLPPELIEEIHTNSGAGLKTQDECDILANMLDNYINLKFEGWETIGLNTGWYYKQTVNSKGELNSMSVDEEESKKLSFALGSQIFLKNGEFEVDGFIYTTSHKCYVEHLHEFIAFLRECGGFEIR